MKKKLSVVLATRNEEKNIKRVLSSVKNIADEIIIADENSTDKTVEIAEQLGAKVFSVPHSEIFHITKQKALEKATGEWILQLDADEVVTPGLKNEINIVLKNKHSGVRNIKKKKLFQRHQRLIEKRDGKIGTNDGQVVGYFIPRVNMFLGKPLIHGGVYPDGVIRLLKNGYAKFPQKSVHEQISLRGKVAWLENSLKHYDSPTLSRYFSRMNRYTSIRANEYKTKKMPKNVFYIIYMISIKPILIFVSIYFRHVGLLDGVPGFLWAFFSSLHYPISYFKYLVGNNNQK